MSHFVDIDDLCYLFGYKNKRSVYEAVRRGTFPIATYKRAGRIVADKEVVRAYFRKIREEGLKSI